MPLSSSIQARLKTQHESVPELLKGLSEERLKERVNPGKWSAFEQLVHLVAYQPVFMERLHLIEQQQTPVFERYVADNDPVFQQYLDYSLPGLLTDLSTQRFIINNHLFQLGDATLRKAGIHPVYGSFSMGQWADFFLLHEAHHLFAIFMLTASLRKGPQQ